jgi:hypothetical protein
MSACDNPDNTKKIKTRAKQIHLVFYSNLKVLNAAAHPMDKQHRYALCFRCPEVRIDIAYFHIAIFHDIFRHGIILL